MVKLIFFLIMMQDTVYLSENEAYRMAISQSPMVLAQKMSVLSSYYTKKSQFSSFLPQISISGTYTRLSLQQTMKMFMMDSLVMTPSGAFIPMGHYEEIPFSQKDNYSLGLSIEQPLFTFGKLLYSYKSADYNLKSEVVKDSITRGYVGIITRELYTQAILAKAYYNLMVQIDSELGEVYKIAKDKYENGTATEIEYLQAELAYRSQKNNVLTALNGLKSIKSMLKVMLNIDPSTPLVLTDSITLMDTVFEKIPSEYMDIKAMDYSISGLEYQKKVVERLTLPSIFTAFSYSYQKPFGMENTWKGSWALTLGVSWTLFDGLKSFNQAKSLESTIKQLKVLRDMKKRQREADLKVKLNELISAKKAYEIALENVKLAEKLYSASKKQYEEGYLSYTDFSNIVINYHSTLVNRLQSLADLKVKQLEYLRYLKGYFIEGSSESTKNAQTTTFGNMSGEAKKQSSKGSKKGGF